MTKLEITYLPMTEITPYEGNAKQHPKEQVERIVKSIKQFKFRDPIAVYGEHNIIVEGHGRLLALQRMTKEEREKADIVNDMVPVIRLDDMTDEERRAYTLAHNKLTMDSGFDLDTLNAELEKITGIDMAEFDFRVNLGTEDAVEDDFDTTPPEEPKSKVGQLYKLGRHRLICGDSTDPKVLKRLMGGQLADMWLTDPPYNVDYTGKTKDALKIQGDKQDDGSFRAFLDEAFAAADSVLKPGAAAYIWHADSEGYNFRGALMDAGYTVRECLIWVKDTLVLGRQDYQWQHEPCLYTWKEGAGHPWYSDRKQTTLLHFDRPKKSELHPTMKPIPLFDYLIKNSSKGGDIVLDDFGGSGTTIMACEQNGRCGYSCELDPRYVDVIINRWEEFTGQKAELLEDVPGDNA